jgi:hypothetical protein
VAISKIVEETEELFKSYSNIRQGWAERAQEDRRFRFGEQWSEDDVAKLTARGQAPVVVNRIHPAVEAAKAMLTANKPSFRVSPREDSDTETAQALNGLLQYIWQSSDGDTEMRQCIDDYYVTGLGAIYVYVDPSKDMGKGEVCMTSIDPMCIYIDPSSRNRFGDDAENIIISRLLTKQQLTKLYPLFKSKISAADSSNDSDMPTTSLESTGIVFPEDATIMAIDTKDEFVREYIRFKKVSMANYRVYEKATGTEDLLDEKSYKEYVRRPAWVIGGQVYTDEQTAQQAYQQAQQQMQMQVQQMNQQLLQQAEQQNAQQQEQLQQEADVTGEPAIAPPIQAQQVQPQEIQVQTITFQDMIDKDMIDVVKILQPVIRQYVIVGQTLLFEGILQIEQYPVVFFMNLYNRTPYPLSDVRMVRSLQEEINKTRSLIIAHATTSTTNKIILQTGSVDIGDFEDRWASPTGVMEADLTAGELQVIHPAPLPGELYKKEEVAKSDIDHQMGLYEFMMGNAATAPSTYRATISIDEFGQRRIKSKLMDIEAGLKRLGEITISLMQKLYTTEKIVRVIQPNNSMSEYMINKRMYDDYSRVIKTVNNIGVGRYDVIVVTGSTLPTNRYAQLEFYMEAYKMGIIDRQEVLKKTEVFDQEGVLMRMDEIAKMQGQIQQMDETIKGLKGDLQTAQRETMHAKQESELARFKNELSGNSQAVQHATKLHQERLGDELAMQKERANLAIQKATLGIKNKQRNKTKKPTPSIK